MNRSLHFNSFRKLIVVEVNKSEMTAGMHLKVFEVNLKVNSEMPKEIIENTIKLVNRYDGVS